MTLLMLYFFYKSFSEMLMTLSLVAEIFFGFLVHFHLRLNRFCLSSFLADSKSLVALARTDFISLALGFSGREKSLAVVP